MAKENKKGFKRPIRNRGEDVGYDLPPRFGYDYMTADQYEDRSQERAIRRHEVRSTYNTMYRDAQQRDQRAFARVRDVESEFWAGIDPRRRQEVADGGLVQEDHTQIANLPRQAIHHEYPQAGYYSTPYIDDTLRGEDPELDDNLNSAQRRQYQSNMRFK